MALKELNLEEKAPKGISEKTEEELEFELENETEETEDSDDEWTTEDDDFDDIDDDPLEGSEEDEEEASDDEEDEDDDDEEEEFKARGPRENARIRDLVKKSKEAERKAKEERNERIKAQNRFIELQKASAESGKTLLSKNIDSLKARLKAAKESSDYETEVAVQAELNKAQMDLSTLENWKAPELLPLEDLDDLDEEVEQSEKEEPAALEDAPETVQRWVKKNSWFRNPKTPKDGRRQQEAVLYSQILVNRGYKMESQEFFDLIDKRLKKLGLAKPEKDNVQLKSKEEKSSTGRKPKKISQTVQGTSRKPASSNKSKKVRLTKEQQDIADLYGISYAEYARELLKIEEAEKKGKRMTSIFD